MQLGNNSRLLVLVKTAGIFKNKRTHKNIVFEPEYYNIPNNNNDFNLFNGFDYIETNEIIDDDFYKDF